MFLFSVEDESGELLEMDGSREVCGFVLGGEIQENLPDLIWHLERFGFMEQRLGSFHSCGQIWISLDT